jgi:2-oxoglutarate dehydrogenase E2 component (dihydrolipoamide succinyltransferase)
VDAEIPSPAAGTLEEIKIAEGATVQINTVVAVIGDGAGASVAAAAAAPVAAPATIEAPAAPAASAPAAGGGAGTDVPMPQMGESITEGTITKWLKQVGERVERDEPLFEISTDKVDAEIPSPAAGVLTEIKFPEGATVGVNTVVAVIGGSGAGKAVAPAPAKAAPAAAAAPVAAVAEPVAASAAGERLRSSPLVRKIAKDNNVDLSQVAGTGSAGRITKGDIESYLEKPKSQVSESRPGAPASVATPAAAAKAPAAPAPLPGELVPMTKMRSIIARRMVESKQTSPHVHTVFKVDMTRIVRLREKEKAKYEQRNGVKLTYMPFITRAAIVALRKHPIVNGSVVSGENGVGDAIRYNKNINIGIAVALEWGLIVPVIKQAEEKNFLGIARAIVDVAGRARGKKLATDEISGGTFTLTNSGIFGEQFGLPIINQPQAAILGIGGMSKEAVVVTDKDKTDSIAVRTIQYFSLGFDHRIVDGADAGKFMSDFKEYLEEWSEEIG